MSINQRFGIDQKRKGKLSKYFQSIDFELNDRLTNTIIRQRQNDTKIGILFVGNFKTQVSINEIDNIIESLNESISNYSTVKNTKTKIYGTYSLDLSKSEIYRLIETLNNAKQVFMKAYLMGRYRQ